VRALRQYLDAEGAETIEDTESFPELARGEVVTSEDLRRSVTEIIGGAEKARAQQK
jgi:predicted transcriptional regulator